MTDETTEAPQTTRRHWDQPTGKERAFAKYLVDLLGSRDTNGNEKTKPNRAALAALRRGLKSPGEATEMFPYVAWAFGDNMSPQREDDYLLVAALFATHQGKSKPYAKTDDVRRNSLGGSFARLRIKTESGSVEKRFVALLNASREELTTHLRHAISLLKAHDVDVDWAQLLHDIKGWEWPGRPVQRRWAYGYWYTDWKTENPSIQPDEEASADSE